jgi:hypothetical protein
MMEAGCGSSSKKKKKKKKPVNEASIPADASEKAYKLTKSLKDESARKKLSKIMRKATADWMDKKKKGKKTPKEKYPTNLDAIKVAAQTRNDKEAK